MGVDYSSSIGYGIAVTAEDASNYLRACEPYEDGQIPTIMDNCGWDLLDYDYCGDWMNGDTVYFFYIRGTEALYVDSRSSDSLITEFGLAPEITDDAVRQLNELADHFGITGEVGWKLISNVY